MISLIDMSGAAKAHWLGASALAGSARSVIFAAVGLAVLIAAPRVYALPEGGAVAAGAASIAATPNAVTVKQASQNAVINWQSFGIGVGEAVTFQQPNANSVALNRVLGAVPLYWAACRPTAKSSSSTRTAFCSPRGRR